MSFGPHETKKPYLRHFGEENLTFLSEFFRACLPKGGVTYLIGR